MSDTTQGQEPVKTSVDQNQDAVKDPNAQRYKKEAERRKTQVENLKSELNDMKEFLEDLGMDRDELRSLVDKTSTDDSEMKKLKRELKNAQTRIEGLEASNSGYVQKFQDQEISRRVNETLDEAKILSDRRKVAADIVRNQFSFEDGELIGDVKVIAKSLADTVPEWVQSGAKAGVGAKPASRSQGFTPEKELSGVDLIDRGVKGGQLQTRTSASPEELL